MINSINPEELKNVVAISSTPDNKDDEYSIPIGLSDIINICQEFSKLGWQVQSQIDSLLEIGVEESIKSNVVRHESLPHIKNFLNQIIKNPYFGDATYQAEECIYMIDSYYESVKNLSYN